jgi:NAD(P)-dependent dehydrogenase (short-subunit alcohol dehydrogenase family)
MSAVAAGGPLAGQRVLVTGAAGGIGRGVVAGLARAGASVVAADLERADPSGAVADLRAEGLAVHGAAADAGDPDAVRALVADATRLLGGLDGLVNAAGIPGRGRIEDVDDARWAAIVAANLSSVFYTCREVVPLLRGRGGTIVNIASSAALREWPGSVAYAAGKAGVVAITRTLAAELAREDVRVWAVCPTAVETPMFPRTFEGSADPVGDERRFRDAQPMGRVLTVDEVTAAVVDLFVRRPPYTPDPYVV